MRQLLRHLNVKTHEQVAAGQLAVRQQLHFGSLVCAGHALAGDASQSLGGDHLIKAACKGAVVQGLQLHRGNPESIGETYRNSVDQVVAVSAETCVLRLRKLNDQVSSFLLWHLVSKALKSQYCRIAEAWLDLHSFRFIYADNSAPVVLNHVVAVSETLKRAQVEFLQGTLQRHDAVPRAVGLLLASPLEAVAEHRASGVSTSKVWLVGPRVDGVKHFVKDAFRCGFKEVAATTALSALHNAFFEAIVSKLVVDSSQLG